MTKNQIRLPKVCGPLTLVLALFVSACSAVPPQNAIIPNSGDVAKTVAVGMPSLIATSEPVVQNSILDCAAISSASQDLSTNLIKLVNLTPSTDFSTFANPASPAYVDFTKLGKELDMLAALPDPTGAVALTVGKPSESVAYLRQLLDIAQADIKTQGIPFKDTTLSGLVVLGRDSQWRKELSPLALAIADTCPGFTLPTGTPLSK